MCGISGVIVAEGTPDQWILDAQLRLLRHRGPDAEGAFVRGKAAIAQNRLAVIDLLSGDPPLMSEDGRVGAVLNGEIYNFRSLRAELERDGHRLSSTGDTEVLAHLAEDFTPSALAARLDGMFAFAVWDEGRNRLILGRDRLGKKPLYYAEAGRDFVFASELKALLAHPGVPRDLDESVIPSYLAFGYVPTPRTFYRTVRSVPPGHILVLEPGSAPRLERYWRPPLVGYERTERVDVSLAEAAEGVRERLELAVERRLLADVPLGSFLSGGIDSSAIAAIASKQVDRKLSTFTIGFDDADGFDERPYARVVARHLGTDHHEYVVKPDAVELIERLVWHYDQPFGDSSAVPTYYLAEATRGDVTVALCGDGGDEIFGGYERFAAALAADGYGSLPSFVRDGVLKSLEALPSLDPRGRLAAIRRFAQAADQGLPDAYLSWISFVPEVQRNALLGSIDDSSTQEHRDIWRQSEKAHPLDRLLDLNLRTYLLDDLLPKADRMSMAHGLELRSPFLDKDLLEYALRLPPKVRIRGISLKRVLKAAVSDLLPQEILQRRKRGFGVPLDRWFREDLKSYVGGTLGQPNALVKQYLRSEAVDAMLADHSRGRHNHGHALWTLLTFEVFLRGLGQPQPHSRLAPADMTPATRRVTPGGP